MSKLAKFLISDLNADWSKPSIKFFRSNGSYGYILWLTIIDTNFKKKNIGIEMIATQLEKYASRRTIIDFINKGVDAGFINKINSNQDKRKIYIEPSRVTIKEYTEWSDEFIKNIT